MMQHFHSHQNFNFARQVLTGLFVLISFHAWSQCTVYNVGGGGAISATTTSYAITLSGSQSSTNYQLYRYGVAVGSTVAGTGSALSWASQSAEGPYTIVATGSGCTQTMSGTANITYPAPYSTYSVQWTNLVGVTVSGNTVTKTASIGWGNAGASSQNVLAANTDGWMEFQTNTTSTYAMVGLSSTDLNANYTSINFTFATSNGQVYENGALKLGSTPTPVGWETFRIERVAGKIYYRRNGTLVYTSTQTSTSSLIVDIAINNNTQVVSNVICSFGATGQQAATVTRNAVWQNLVGVSVSSANTLTKTAAAGWGTGGASTLNTLNANRDGFVQLTVANVTQQKAFGLTRADSDAGYTSLDYAWLLNGTTASVSLAGTSTVSVTVAAGDILKVERSGSHVYFWQNGVAKYSAPNAYTAALIADASLYDASATLGVIQTSFWIPYTQGNVPDQIEFLALKAMYDSLSGSTWKTKTNWPATGSWPTTATAATMGTWYNIVVSAADVTQVNLHDNLLTGKLPAAFTNLTQLSITNLGNNSISGLLADFSPLVNLTSISLYNNNLSGAIPSSFGNLTALSTIALFGNHFTGSIPSGFAALTNLVTLQLNKNNLSGALPSAVFTNLTQLTTLDLSTNQFTGSIPASITSLTSLTTLSLAGNALSGSLPTAIGNLVNLTTLDLSANSLTGSIPHEIGNLTNLTTLYLHQNQFSDIIPSEFKNLAKLTQLYLYSNQLTGPLPEFFGNTYPNISQLLLYSNQLSGGIPASYANLSNVQNFQVQSNQLSGPLHDGLFANWVKAATINVSTNAFTGAFPSSIGNAVKVVGLYANNNQFSSVPATLNQLALATTINFSSNVLTALPDLSTQANKTNLAFYAATNQLDFAQLKTLKNAGLKTLTINPQNNLHDVTVVNVMAGGALTITARPLNSTTTITWQKQSGPTTWVSVNASNQNTAQTTYYISAPTTSNAGIYNYKMTDTSVTGITITSDPITVNITDAANAQGTYLGTPLFNGNITAAAWRTDAAYATGNSDYKGLYLYKYDTKYQLQEAQFAVPDFTMGTFALAGNNFRELGYTYDPNGNIQTLKRYDGSGNKIHDLSYTYTANKNQLQSVTNSGASFRSYHYNQIGQMDTQDNATGADQYVDYDVTGKVTCVFTDASKTQKVTRYTYDDRGFRLSKETYDASGALQFTTWYIRDASGNVMSIYNQQANDTNLTLEETPIYGSGKLGMYRPKSNGGGEYVYELTDHLGNVRATLKNETTVYLATMEDNGAADYTNPRVSEQAYFTNLFETEKRDTRMNHTVASAAVATPANSSYLSWTSSDTNKKMIGAGITLKVETGDQISLEAWAKYQNAATYTRDATTAMMAGLLSNAFIGTNGLELTTTAVQDFTNAVPLMLAGTSSDASTRPYAYLNYLVYDQNFVFKDGGAMRVPSSAGFDAGLEAVPGHIQQVSFASPITIAQTGFVYVWVSNESAGTQVWWDDLKVSVTGNRVTQATDYYPFGLTMRSQTQITEPTYRFGYQGQYAEKDDETGWNHFELREFDPVIVRTTTTDPAGQYWSPYLWVGNDPINNLDPDGAYSWFGAAWRNVFSGGSGVYQSGTDGGKKVYGFNVDGVAHFGADARNGYSNAPTIQARENNFFGNLKKDYGDNFLGGAIYSTVENAYITMQLGKSRTNLEGYGVDRDEITEAGVSTLMSRLPIAKLSSPLFKGINAAQFSKIFKGTFISKLQPKIRGVLNTQLNKQVVKKQAKLVITAGTGAAKLADDKED